MNIISLLVLFIISREECALSVCECVCNGRGDRSGGKQVALSSEVFSAPTNRWSGVDNKKPHLPFQHPPDHYHNSAPPATLGSRDTEMTQNFASASSLLPQRNRDVKGFFFFFFWCGAGCWGGCGVGAEISQGLWSHSWYKKGEAFDVAMELCSNEARYAAICPCQTRGGITEWQPAR